MPKTVAALGVASYRIGQYWIPTLLGGILYATLRVGPWSIKRRSLATLRARRRVRSEPGERAGLLRALQPGAQGPAVMLAGDLLAWGLPRLRDLPWRRTRDPWAVLVSEVMLQQTQVPRVIPKWQAFMAAYPATADCAAAPLGDVLRLWQGLGYPRRARNLHAAAAQVEALGGFPTTLDGLLALPGWGSTRHAVLAFAFEADAAVVDTNIARVHARVAGRRLTSGEVQRAADAALPRGQAWAWNQCLMDLGATVCRPQAPQCAECPLLAEVRVARAG